MAGIDGALGTPLQGLGPVIFVTVGTQEPFDRLVRTVDRWAERNPGQEILAQIGAGERPRHLRWLAQLDAADFQQKVEAAEVIIAHAGMGSILSALTLGKRLLVMPRKATLGEHRNEHQTATVRRLEELGLIVAAKDEHELTSWLDRLEDLPRRRKLGPHASSELLQSLRSFFAS